MCVCVCVCACVHAWVRVVRVVHVCACVSGKGKVAGRLQACTIFVNCEQGFVWESIFLPWLSIFIGQSLQNKRHP